MRKLKKITPIEADFGKWFTDVVKHGNLIQYGDIKGMISFKPLSYGIWENVQKILNHKFKSNNIQNVYLPLLIPEKSFNKEKDHVEGFSHEALTATRVGNKDLNEPLVIRPTSEIQFSNFFKAELNSYSDLPLLFNQWANVLRWEKTTNPFLRNSEFLWQEGHTLHQENEEANNFAIKMLETYSDFFRDYLAIPTIIGEKTERERFAGAQKTFTIEAMMQDGKALQAGTSHNLGQNFTEAFDVKYKNSENQLVHPYQTSWGISTRLIGALIMVHGDNKGIVIPPKIAPIQVDVLTLFAQKNLLISETAKKIIEKLNLAGISSRIDSTDKMPGFKAAKSEIEGTPLRIEIGPRDIRENLVTIVRRDIGEKLFIKVDEVVSHVENLLVEIQSNLYKRAESKLQSNIVWANSYSELKDFVSQNKFVLAFFDGSQTVEKNIQNETFATARCIPWKYSKNSEGKCIITNEPTKRVVLFARAY